MLVGNVLQDDYGLGQQLSVVQLQYRHVAVRIERAEIDAAVGELGLRIDLDQFERRAGLVQSDMGCEGAGTAAVIEFHKSPAGLDPAAPGPGTLWRSTIHESAARFARRWACNPFGFGRVQSDSGTASRQRHLADQEPPESRRNHEDSLLRAALHCLVRGL